MSSRESTRMAKGHRKLICLRKFRSHSLVSLEVMGDLVTLRDGLGGEHKAHIK